MFRYFVIGSGSIGMRHFNNLKSLGADVLLVPWRGIDLLRLSADLKATRGKAGVVIATATRIREELVSICVDAGVAMYIEKPVAYHAEELERIFEIPQNLQERSMAGLMMRYHPVVRYLAEHKPADIFRAHFEIGHNVNQWRSDWCFSKSYASDPEGGGVLLDLCHEIDLAHLFCGEMTLRDVASTSHPDFEGVDIASHLTLSSGTGVHCTVSMDYLAPNLIRRGSMVGLDAQVDYNLANNSLVSTTSDKQESKDFPVERNQMFVDAMSDFIRLAQGEEILLNPIAPRLNSSKEVCRLISQAWCKRDFTGKIKANLQ
jgi:predicted dehydrogenase